MKSLLILLMFSFTSNVILSSPCESESCAYNGLPAEFNPIIPEEAVILIARCYVGCCENKLVNLTAGIFKLSSTTLEWPSAFVDFTSNSKAQACVGGCYRLAANTPTKAACHDSCRLVQGENFDAGTCQQGCDVYYDLQMAANHSQSKKPVPPVRPPQVLIYPFDDAIPSIHLNLADSQTSKSHAPFVAIGDIQSGYLNAFVIRMSYNGFDNFQYLLSSLEDDYINPREEFSCRTVNISFAVVNVYGISDFSPVGTICGGGIAYPKKVNSLAYEFKDDPEGRSDRLFKVLLTWQHSEDHAFVSQYEIHVSTENGNNFFSNTCPDYRKPRVFHVPRDDTSYLMESIRNGSDYSFRIPAECDFIVEVISLPESTNESTAIDNRAKISFTTEKLGDSNLQLGLERTWMWNPVGFYTLSLNITLPNTTYIPTCVSHVLIVVHIAISDPGDGIIKVKQVLPSDRIIIEGDRLHYPHTLKARYPPLEDNEGLEYEFRIKPNLKDSCFYYRGLEPKDINFFAPSFSPTPVTNVTIVEAKLDGNLATVSLSWQPPQVPNGQIWSYAIHLSHEEIPDEQKLQIITGENTEYTITKVIIPSRTQYIMIRADNFYRRANWSEPITLKFPPERTPEDLGLIYGLVPAAVVVSAVLIVLIILTIICCWQKRKDKVVFLKDTENEWYVGGKGSALDTVPVDTLPVDQWEISPDQIIMDKQLGSGNFGEVFLGKLIGALTTPGVGTYIGTRSVAVKLLKNDAGSELKVDFLKEISTMKKISFGRCPHVVNMVGCCTLQEPLALVLEYASYGDLLEYLRTMRRNYLKKTKDIDDKNANPYLSPIGNTVTHIAVSNDYVEEFQTVKSMQEVTCDDEKTDENPYASLGELEPFDLISFAYQIAMGMEYLASIPIVHRDLACRNILVDENKVLKISDFGLARADDLYVKNTDGKLPLRWMALESIVERTFSHKTDVWSYGVTLWEICTLGGHPYPTIGNKQLLQFLLQGNRLEKPHNCSDDIYNVMRRCWIADTEERPTFAELRATFDIMMSNQQTESYVDLNVDDLLPYYQMKPAGDDTELPHTQAFPVVGPQKSLPIDSSDVQTPDNTSIDEPAF